MFHIQMSLNAYQICEICVCVCFFCVCVFMYVYVCLYVHTYTCVHFCMYVCMYVCMYECVYLHTYVPSRGPFLDEPSTVVSYKTACQCIHSTYVKSSFCFFVTSHCKHILSRGSSFLRAVDCIIAVRNDWGLKKPDNHTDDGS